MTAWCNRQEFFDNETMALCMTHLYGSLRRCLTSPDTASSWEKSEIGEKWTHQNSTKENQHHAFVTVRENCQQK
jgi:hypothetical protein